MQFCFSPCLSHTLRVSPSSKQNLLCLHPTRGSSTFSDWSHLKSRHCCNCCLASSCSPDAETAAEGHHLLLPQWKCWLHTNPIWGLRVLHLTQTSSSFWTYVKGFFASLLWQRWTFLLQCSTSWIITEFCSHTADQLRLLHIQSVALKIQTKTDLKSQNKAAPPYCRLLALLSIYKVPIVP